MWVLFTDRSRPASCKAEWLRVQDAKAEVRSRSGTGCAWTRHVTLQPEQSEQFRISGCSPRYISSGNIYRAISCSHTVTVDCECIVNNACSKSCQPFSWVTACPPTHSPSKQKMTHRAFILANLCKTRSMSHVCSYTITFLCSHCLFENTLWAIIIRTSISALHQATKVWKDWHETTNASRKGISKRRSSICSAQTSHWGASCNHQKQWPGDQSQGGALRPD